LSFFKSNSTKSKRFCRYAKQQGGTIHNGYAPDFHLTPKNPSPKKWATEVAQNALRALLLETQSLPRLCESLQMNNASPAKALRISMTVMTPAITA